MSYSYFAKNVIFSKSAMQLELIQEQFHPNIFIRMKEAVPDQTWTNKSRKKNVSNLEKTAKAEREDQKSI